ncbi:MAG: hypothetical protein ABI593_11265, partial [Betaproteobacteria bacterium]
TSLRVLRGLGCTGFRRRRAVHWRLFMKIRSFAFTLMALSSATAFAATSSPIGHTLGLGETVARLETRYPGSVVAIEFDGSGDKAAHYHVDMLFPTSGLARLDVDAVTLEIASRESVPLAAGSAALVYAAALVTASIDGQMLGVNFDASNGVPAHYDVDVRLPQGAIARLKVDAATREIGWRIPAIITD